MKLPRLVLRRRRKFLSQAILSAVLFSLTRPVLAQPPEQEEPRWVTLRLSDAYLKFDGEAEEQTITSGAGTQSTIKRLYLAPAVGLGAEGSVYHPNLLNFNVMAEPGYAWQEIDSSGGNSTHQDSVLQNYRGTGTLFQSQPFSTTVTGNRSHSFTQYDFFNQAVVDSSAFGVSSGYRTGPVPVTLSYEQTSDDSTSLAQHSLLDQHTVELHARNERQNGNNTDLNYRYGDYNQTTDTGSSAFKTSNDYQYATLTDSEHFGSRKQMGLNTSVNYNQLDATELPSKNVVAQTDLGVEHTEHLRSDYSYSFNGYTDSFSDSEQHFLRAALHHQLYDSLASGIEAHGSFFHSGDAASSLDSDTAGMLGTLSYIKRLAPRCNLTIGNSAGWDHTSQTSAEASLEIANENHTLSVSPTPLKQPRDTAIISVTTQGGTIPLSEGLDYSVNRQVDPWEIQRIASSTLVHDGDAVQVTYTVLPNPGGSYDTVQDQFEIRVDLFDRLLGFYGRMTVLDNFTNAPGFVLEDIFEAHGGVEFSWQRLNLAADYGRRNSTFYKYDSFSLSEGYLLKAFSDSSISINLSQRWTDYINENQRATYYDFIARYDWRPTSYLTWAVEGGLQQQRGRGLDQDLAAARTHLDWKLGKLVANLGYEYEAQDFSGQNRLRHFVFLRMERKF